MVMFLLPSMIVPGSIYWNLGIGFDKKEVLDDEEGMQNMNHLGQAIAWLGKTISSISDSTPFPRQIVQLQ